MWSTQAVDRSKRHSQPVSVFWLGIDLILPERFPVPALRLGAAVHGKSCGGEGLPAADSGGCCPWGSALPGRAGPHVPALQTTRG